jgi:putative transposase
MLNWTHRRGIKLRLSEPEKPIRNSHDKSFIGWFPDGCLNVHWFMSLPHAQAFFETRRSECNEERAKEALGGLTPNTEVKWSKGSPD